eukprot:3341821-Lingulodinium_polyedra.AAC.1
MGGGRWRATAGVSSDARYVMASRPRQMASRWTCFAARPAGGGTSRPPEGAAGVAAARAV